MLKQYAKYLVMTCLAALLLALPVHAAPIAQPKPQQVAKAQVRTEKPPSTVQQPDTPAPAAVSETPVADTPAPEPEPAPVPPHAPVIVGDHEQLMIAAGIDPADRGIADDIISKESGWCATKWEGQIGWCPEAPTGMPAGSSGAYGLCQALGPDKMASAGSDYMTNPVTQLRWCASYAQGYGGWTPAKQFRDCLGACYSPRTKTIVYKNHTWW